MDRCSSAPDQTGWSDALGRGGLLADQTAGQYGAFGVDWLDWLRLAQTDWLRLDSGSQPSWVWVWVTMKGSTTARYVTRGENAPSYVRTIHACPLSSPRIGSAHGAQVSIRSFSPLPAKTATRPPVAHAQIRRHVQEKHPRCNAGRQVRLISMKVALAAVHSGGPGRRRPAGPA